MDKSLPEDAKFRAAGASSPSGAWFVSKDPDDGRVWARWGEISLVRKNGTWVPGCPSADELMNNFSRVGDSSKPNPESLSLLREAMAAVSENPDSEAQGLRGGLLGGNTPSVETPQSLTPASADGKPVIYLPEAETSSSPWKEIDTGAVSALRRRLREYEKSLPRPDMESPRPRSYVPSLDTDFDVNRILGVFDLVRPEPGYVLDYIYLAGGEGGQPFLYARPVDGVRVDSVRDYFKRFQLEMPTVLLGQKPTDEDSRPYLDHMAFEKTDIGFFQFALFCMTARRFKLYDHSNNNSRMYILDDEERPEWIRARKLDFHKPSNEELSVFSLLDIRPKVQIYGDNGWVRLCNYGMSPGLNYCIIELEWPNRLCSIIDDIIIEGGGELL